MAGGVTGRGIEHALNLINLSWLDGCISAGTERKIDILGSGCGFLIQMQENI